MGHQAIVAAFGGDVSRSNVPVHGRASWVEHDGTGVFEGLAVPVCCGRYHSLVAQSPLPKALRATAHTVDDRFVMGVKHVEHPTFGVQFHPESVLTKDGVQMFASFLKN